MMHDNYGPLFQKCVARALDNLDSVAVKVDESCALI
jgi:hypothetical protein